jgi:hypothetical protein
LWPVVPSELLNRETKKKICVEVVSPPGVGKIVFSDPLLIFMGCHEQIMNAKKIINFL